MMGSTADQGPLRLPQLPARLPQQAPEGGRGRPLRAGAGQVLGDARQDVRQPARARGREAEGVREGRWASTRRSVDQCLDSGKMADQIERATRRRASTRRHWLPGFRSKAISAAAQSRPSSSSSSSTTSSRASRPAVSGPRAKVDRGDGGANLAAGERLGARPVRARGPRPPDDEGVVRLAGSPGQGNMGQPVRLSLAEVVGRSSRACAAGCSRSAPGTGASSASARTGGVSLRCRGAVPAARRGPGGSSSPPPSRCSRRSPGPAGQKARPGARPRVRSSPRSSYSAMTFLTRKSRSPGRL